MDEFTGKVAVVTGAASGIGLAIAQRCAKEGMRVVLADIDRHGLDRAAEKLGASGATVLAIPTDVADAAQVEALAERAFARFGAVHLLCNNAGIAGVGTLWENTLADWQRLLGVNLWGVIHGIRAFVPRMLAQDSSAQIVNTSSVAGLFTPPLLGSYTVSKHAIVALSEVLHLQLAQHGDRVRVSVLCPSPATTHFADEPVGAGGDLAAVDAELAAVRGPMQQGIAPSQVADRLFAALREGQFYILTDDWVKPQVQQRLENILNERNPA